MNFQTAYDELMRKPPKVSFELLFIEIIALLVVSYVLVQVFA